jgi:hypothetical protein
MGQRLDLHTILLTMGATKVYFQPPASLSMAYPCIRYERNNVDIKFADNQAYAHKKQYIVTVIDSNPDSLIPDNVAKIPFSRFNRHFSADNLHHDVYYIYF